MSKNLMQMIDCYGVLRYRMGCSTSKTSVALNAEAKFLNAKIRDHIEQLEAEIARLRKDADKQLTVPNNAEEMQAFIGGNYNQMQYGDESGDYEDKTRIRYTLTIHDLLSCFEWWDFHNPLLADHHSGDVNEMIKPDTSTQEVG